MKPNTIIASSLLILATVLLALPSITPAQMEESDFVSNIQPGLYGAPELNNQGLIIARQGNAVAAYPLIYDEDGDSRWFFSGNVLNTDGTYLADLFALSGGQCLGCPAPMAPPDLEIVGSIAINGSDPLEPQMTIITGEEEEAVEQTVNYEPVIYGHIVYDLYGEKVAGLDGKWALTLPDDSSESGQCVQELTGPVFDIELDNYFDAADRAISDPPAPILLFNNVTASDGSMMELDCSATYSNRFTATDRPFCIFRTRDAESGGVNDLFYADIISVDQLKIWPFAEPEAGEGLFGVDTTGCSQTAVRIQ